MALDDNAVPTGYDAIDADITAMADFAKRLAAGVTEGYGPQLSEVGRRMQTAVPAAHPGFPELRIFLEQHERAQLTTFANATNFREGTIRFSDAAQQVSDEYRSSDAFANASVADIDNAFKLPGEPADGSPTGVSW